MGEFICSINQGQLKGIQENDIHGEPFLSFYGIPYAKPPVGELRFKDPQEPENWQGIRDATIEGNPCLANQMLPTEQGVIAPAGSEDCLFLNVYTHKLSTTGQDDLKPVMVFIHGGAFTQGSSSKTQCGAQVLMTEDVVLVTINYRLGVFGFLSFEDPSLEVPGNAGMKDQVQALKWVQKNIKAFGGNPENVTIFGISAGGAAVHYLVLSPLAKGLFHKAIAQSGSALNPWAQGENSPKKLAETFCCFEQDDKKLLEFLQSVSGTEILKGQRLLTDWLDGVNKRPFSPSVENKSPQAFISEDPINILQSGNYNQVPIMMGYTKDEGMLVEMTKIFPEMHLNEEEYVPYFFGYQIYDARWKEINKKICQFYYGSDTPDLNNRQALYDIITDITFLRGINNSVKSHTKTSSQALYYYRFSLDSDLNGVRRMLNLGPSVHGTCHGDDGGYLLTFMNQEFKVEPGSAEEVGYKRVVKMWTNFARTGQPIPTQDSLLNVEWKAATKSQLNFLDIGNDLVPGTNPDAERMKFWDELYKELPGY